MPTKSQPARSTSRAVPKVEAGVGALDGAHAAATPTSLPMASDVGAQGLSILSDIANRQALTFTPDRALGIEIVQMQSVGPLLGAGMQRPWDWSAGGAPAQPSKAKPVTMPATKPAKASRDHGKAKA